MCFRLHEDSADQIPETVFTGDTLVKSIRQRLMTLDDDTYAWPGHGLKTTIGHERRKNPFI